ncbi:hypothetical protein WDU94_001706 [Cyamophila willieti]
MESLQDHWVQNGGSVMAIAGLNYAVIASDTRCSEKSIILSNNQLKMFRLPNNTAVGLTGSMADALEVVDRLGAEIKSFDKSKGRTMSLHETAEMVSLVLYERRIFPYYVQVLLVGVDELGRGGVYSYDPVGHCEKVAYRLHGTSAKFMLASVSIYLSPYETELEDHTDVITMDVEDLTPLVKDLLTNCSELDQCTGGSAEIWIMRPNEDGVKFEIVHHPLRQD